MRYFKEMNSSDLIERIADLRRGELRKVAAELGIQHIHAEILEYLAICNKYSNTPQALVDYLGQTKGSVSQSLIKMESNGLISKTPSPHDKRSVQLALTPKGQDFQKKLKEALPSIESSAGQMNGQLVAVLRAFQIQHGLKGFSTCSTCRYNQKLEDGTFLCGLTQETVTKNDVTKICREHEYAQHCKNHILPNWLCKGDRSYR